MPVIKLKMGGVEATPSPLPVGTYAARILEADYGLSKRSNKPKLSVKYEITQPGFEGRKAFHTFSLQPQALFALKRMLLATGEWSEEDFPEDPNVDMDLDTADLIGLEVGLVIVADTNQRGEPTTKTDREIPVSEVQGPVADGQMDARNVRPSGGVRSLFRSS